jgi:hypothetical protein
MDMLKGFNNVKDGQQKNKPYFIFQLRGSLAREIHVHGFEVEFHYF